MAFSENKITVADLTGKGVTGMADTPNLTTAQMQQKLDEIAKEVIPPKFNALCDDLDATDFASIITSKSTDKMLFQRLNEYDQIEYSVDNVNWFLVASGKEVLDPTLEADNAKKLGGQLPAYYQKTTDNALNTTSKTTTGAINEIKTGLDNVDTTANEAPPYSPSSTYTLGKYVSHEKHIYECTTAIEVAEEWNASHWTQVTLGAEIETANNRLNATNYTITVENGITIIGSKLEIVNGTIYINFSGYLQTASTQARTLVGHLPQEVIPSSLVSIPCTISTVRNGIAYPIGAVVIQPVGNNIYIDKLDTVSSWIDFYVYISYRI